MSALDLQWLGTFLDAVSALALLLQQRELLPLQSQRFLLAVELQLLILGDALQSGDQALQIRIV